MTPLFRLFLRERIAEMAVIYLIIAIVIVLGAWLPYFFSQWTLYRGGFGGL